MTPIQLKAAGLRPNVTLKQLSNSSIDAEEVAFLSRKDCLHPDKPDREIIEAEPKKLYDAFAAVFEPDDCDIIQEMHSRYRDGLVRKYQEATGRGSWPPGKGCHPSMYPHEGYHATLTYIDHESFLRNNSVNREVTDEEWEDTIVKARVWPTLENPVKSIEECKRTFVYGGERVAAYDRPEWSQRSSRKEGQVYTVFDMSTWLIMEGNRRAGCLYLEIFKDTGDNVHELMKAIPGGTAGFAYFNNGTCKDHVTSNIDSLINYSLGRLTGLRQHEWGHTNNLQHEFRNPQSSHRSVMSYAQDNTPYQGYRKAGSPYMYVEDHSWDDLRKFYGDEEAKPIVVPEDPTDPTDPDEPLPDVDLAFVLDGRLRRFKEIK